MISNKSDLRLGAKKWMSTISIAILFLSVSFAQNLEDGQQEIIKDFEAQLEDAQRIIVKPVLQPVVVSKKTYKYDVTIIPLELKYPDPVIKPLAAEPDLPFDSKSFYAKLGYGNMRNPEALIKYFKTDENKLEYFFDLSHYGLDNSKKLINQKMSNTDLKVGFNYRIKENLQLNFKANGIYDQRKIYYNFFDDVFRPISGKPINKVQIGSQFEFFNPEVTSSGLDYKIRFGYSLLDLQSYERRNELVPNVDVTLSKAIGNWKLTLPISANGTLQKGVNDLYAFTFTPTIKTSTERFWLKAGMSFFNDSDLKTKIWPSIHADYALNGKSLHVFVSTEQTSLANNLHHLLPINPWMFPMQPKLTNNVIQKISGGIKSESNFLGFEAEAGYAKAFNQISFVNSINYLLVDQSHATFQNVNAVFLKANIDFAFSDNIGIGGHLVKNFYSEKLYGIPSLELTSFAKIKLINEFITLNPSLTIRDKSRALVATLTSTEEILLNNQVDLSVSSEFNLSKKFALYFEANNVLNNLYRPLSGYPVVGINFNGGIVVRL